MISLSFVSFTLESVPWVLFGYSLVFGPDDRQEVFKRSLEAPAVSDRPGSPPVTGGQQPALWIGAEVLISTEGTS